ncbi:hypothetical protein [uncultured Winogradskyella sp.]|uniref:hypothetical protein n=1 Tax=uncultured Winogradskyella sp. TaxID=395353 RepID=UPI002618C0A1|nr:hypothetical protein [uncultured Winogradskyella sp.]
MKRILFFALIITGFSTSCSIEDDSSVNFFNEFMAIESVDVPDEFILGEVHQIALTYSIPNDCYTFNSILFDVNGVERTVAVVNTVYTNIDCNEVTEPVTVSFDFEVASSDTHVFKFYQGTDSQGQDQYLFVEVPVVE